MTEQEAAINRIHNAFRMGWKPVSRDVRVLLSEYEVARASAAIAREQAQAALSRVRELEEQLAMVVGG